MLKKRLFAFLAVFVLSINVFVLPAFAYEFNSGTGHLDSTNLTYRDALTYCIDFYSYINRAWINMEPRDAKYILLANPSNTNTNAVYNFLLYNTTENTITRKNNNYFTINSQTSTYFFTLSVDYYSRDDVYNLNMASNGHMTDNSVYVPNSYTVVSTNFSILDQNGQEIVPPDHDDYNASISYDSDNNSLLYRFINMSTDTTFGVRYGIYDYADFGLSTVEPGLYFGDSKNLQVIIDWANDHNLDYLNMVAYMTIYNGLDVVETITCPISEALDNSNEEDGMFDEEKEYEDFPDPSDYFSNPPDFPTLSPTPAFPGFDPEHPIDSIAEIIRWLGSVIVTWFQNIIAIVKWVNATIVYYISNGFLFLKDCFLTLVHNIGIALYNLVVKLRALIIHLALPKKESLKERFNDVFPIFGQFRNLFTSWGGGDNTITISLFGQTASINALDSLGSSACNLFYNLSTLMIGATTAFSLFNIITSIFGISLSGRGGDE